jgi:DNA-binding NtrC family response regulator
MCDSPIMDTVFSVRVLIAEDEPSIASGLCEALQLLMEPLVDVQCCVSGEAAAALLATAPFDLLITDHRLPGMTGLDLLACARQCHPELPGILMTGYGTPEIETEAHLLGCTYLTKPFPVAKFLNAVYCILGQRHNGS